jgi:hypothetical protein
VPVGLPQPNLYTGKAEETYLAAVKQYGNVPTQNYAPFVDSATRSR